MTTHQQRTLAVLVVLALGVWAVRWVIVLDHAANTDPVFLLHPHD